MLLVHRRLRGLGDASSTLQLYAAARSSGAMQQILSAFPASRAAVPEVPAPPAGTQSTQFSLAAGDDPTCQCAVERVSQQYAMTSDQQAAALSQCIQNSGAFLQNARAMGVTDLSCDQPIYKKPAFWILGGVGLLAGAFVLKAVL